MSSNIKEALEKLQDNERSKLLMPKNWSETRSSLESEYNSSVPTEVIELYEFTNGGFIHAGKHDTWRIFAPLEMLQAPEDLKVNFKSFALLPFIDIMDNDFICYDFSKSQYTLFNIVENTAFDHRSKLLDFLTQIL